MSKLIFDGVGERFYETGVQKGVLNIREGATYGKGIAWTGLTSASISPEGAEPTDLYADDIKYATLRSRETCGGTIEAYTYPPEFGACDGSADCGIRGFSLGQQKRKQFGFSYRTEEGNDIEEADPDSTTYEDEDTGDYVKGNYQTHLLYGCTASPSERSYETINDSPDAMAISWEYDTNPENTGSDDYAPTSEITIDTRWFDTTNDTEMAILTILEQLLYGTDSGDAVLPTPAQIIEICSLATPTYADAYEIVTGEAPETEEEP